MIMENRFLSIMKNQSIMFKKVSFDIFKDIVIIPNYNNESIENCRRIMWSVFELYLFRRNAFNELHTLSVNNPTIDLKTTRKILYQPNEEDGSFNDNNFNNDVNNNNNNKTFIYFHSI